MLETNTVALPPVIMVALSSLRPHLRRMGAQ
jgi:hypothetical protein